MKDTIKKLASPILLFAANMAMFYYYRNGVTEYDSILDKYLNFFSIFAIMAGAVVSMIFAWACVAFLAVRVVNIKKDTPNTSKVFPTILISAFIVLNAACLISVGALHSKENVINSVSGQAYSYVDFDALFESRDASTYHEQIVLYGVGDEIPVNYKIEQSDSKGGVQTKCVKFSDDDMLAFYYYELVDKYDDYGIIDFDSDEAEALGISRGFHYTIDNSELCIVIVKENTVFEIAVDGRTEIDEAITRQIRSL